jgi:hypothetical protein
LLGAIVRSDFDVPDAGLAERFLLHRISGCRSTLVMTVALIFDSGYRPATLVYDEDVDSLGIDRVKRILIRRHQDFPEASLREDSVASTRCRYIGLYDLERLVFGPVKQPPLFE